MNESTTLPSGTDAPADDQRSGDDHGHDDRAADPRSDANGERAGDGPRPLPDLLARLAEAVPVRAIDTLWVFPARSVETGESRVVVASAFAADDDPDRRRVFTAYYRLRTGERGRADVHNAVAEQALAPAERVPHVVDGVLRRLDDDLADEPPATFAIGGRHERWSALLAALAGDLDDAAEAVDAPDVGNADTVGRVDDRSRRADTDTDRGDGAAETAGEVRAGKVRPGEVRAGKVRAGE